MLDPEKGQGQGMAPTPTSHSKGVSVQAQAELVGQAEELYPPRKPSNHLQLLKNLIAKSFLWLLSHPHLDHRLDCRL
jgi:hypothetical protein